MRTTLNIASIKLSKSFSLVLSKIYQTDFVSSTNFDNQERILHFIKNTAKQMYNLLTNHIKGLLT